MSDNAMVSISSDHYQCLSAINQSFTLNTFFSDSFLGCRGSLWVDREQFFHFHFVQRGHEELFQSSPHRSRLF